jgi:hypothetical protein
MNKITCSDEALQLISSALDMYSRIGMGQFNSIGDHPDVWNTLSDKDFPDRFYSLLKEVSRIYVGSSGYHGIFSRKIGDINRIAFNIHETIRNEFWKRNADPNKSHMVNSSSPAMTCKIAGIKEPEFKIEKTQAGKAIRKIKKNAEL